MKNIRITITILLFTILAIACQNMKDGASGNDSLYQDGQSIMIKNDRLSLEIKYNGKILLNDDETAISHISPGGFIRFKKNDVSFTAEPGKEGQVIYTVYEKRNKVGTDRGKKIMQDAVSEMIANGLFVDERAARLYNKGGVTAVLTEIKSLKTDPAKSTYFTWLLANHSLPAEDITVAISQISSSVYSDMTKGDLLGKVAPVHFKHPSVVKTYLTVANGIKDNMSKGNGLRNICAQPLTNEQFDQLMRVTNGIGSDLEKGNVLKSQIDEKKRTEEQWISLVNETAKVNSGMEKSEVLSQIAQKMPPGEKFRAAYINAAKTLKGSDYEKAMKALR